MLNLMIKGTPSDAVTALWARGFHASDWLTEPRLIDTRSSHIASVVSVRDETEPGVLRWFAETNGQPHPWPAGTLLHWYREDQPYSKV